MPARANGGKDNFMGTPVPQIPGVMSPRIPSISSLAAAGLLPAPCAPVLPEGRRLRQDAPEGRKNLARARQLAWFLGLGGDNEYSLDDDFDWDTLHIYGDIPHIYIDEFNI